MINVGIVVCSDKCFSGERTDTAGKAIEKIVTENGYLVSDYIIVPDEADIISSTLKDLSRRNVQLILTTGGTGFSKRDVTPEATKAVIEKEANGITQAILFNSLAITKNAMLSRAVAGLRNNSLIINLPGSEKAVTESLSYIISALKHGLDVLSGKATECGADK